MTGLVYIFYSVVASAQHWKYFLNIHSALPSRTKNQANRNIFQICTALKYTEWDWIKQMLFSRQIFVLNRLVLPWRHSALSTRALRRELRGAELGGDQTINISSPTSHHIYDGKTGEETAISSELCNRFDRLVLFNTEREKEFDKIK